MTLQLKISLRDSRDPLIWRRVLIDGDASFYELHLVIQGAFEWAFTHLFRFAPHERSDTSIGMLWDDPLDDYEEETRPADKVLLKEALTEAGQHYYYVYDFGDNWEHDILVEKVTDEACPQPRVLAGEGMPPPEDCGGIPGYYHLLEALANPRHPEHKDMKAWLGIKPGYFWDRHYFSLEETNQSVEACLSVMRDRMKDGRMIG